MPVVSINSMFFIRLYRLVAVLVLMPLVVLGQSQNQNHVKSTTYKVETSTSISNPSPEQAVVQVSYFDGLGRPIQQVAHAQGHGGQDIITHIEYDAFGRQTKEYLPYVRPAASLNFSSSAQSEVMAFYASNNPSVTLNPHFATTGNPYSEKLPESSPLNRVYRQAAPGDAWALNPQGNDHSIKFDYQTNDVEEVRHYEAETSWNASQLKYDISLQESGFYNPGELYKTITKDENWTGGTLNTTEEFKDKLGRVVLKRTYNTDGAYDTYYVYDDYGNLTYVIPPLVNTQDGVDSTELSELCYQYKYDYRNRLVEKKLPGKTTWEYIVYDKLDRVSMTGPVYGPLGNQELGWMVTKYDAFGRVVYTGWHQEEAPFTSDVRAEKQSVKNNENGVPKEQRVSSGVVDSQDIKYSNTFYPTQMTLLSVNYYDDYDFPGMSAMASDVYGQDVTSQVKGLNTGAWVRVLNSSSVVFEKSTVLYDEKGRVLRTYKTNYQGGFHQTDVLLDFTGKVIESETTHRYNANATPVTVLEKFTYSPQDRLLTLTHQINQGVEEMIQNNEYDALGQLINKRIGGPVSVSTDGYQKIDYRYNIRGWLTDINNFRNLQDSPGLYPDLFAFHINYERVYDIQGDYTGIVEGLYNGNISETYWLSSTDNTLRKYGYRYDKLNRLKDAYFQQPFSMDHNCQSYNEHLSYDKNGNILTLNRQSRIENFPVAVEIDHLEYFYQGNQLTKVTDLSGYPQGFKDDSDGTNDDEDDYRYDAFGNMYKDENKQIVFITYNHLNLPVEIDFLNGSKISYLYNAAGQKLRKIVTDLGEAGGISTTEYLDGFQYNNAVLQFFSHPEGYVLNTPDRNGDPSFDYVYQYKDHLGNIRMNFLLYYPEGSFVIPHLRVLEENHYYPFGLKHENYNTERRKMAWDVKLEGGEEIDFKKLQQVPNSGYQYKYNGKELQDELGLNVTAMDFRQYDNAIGRFYNIDAMADIMPGWTPYRFGYNNPVFWKDPSGLLESGGDNEEWEGGTIQLNEVVVTAKKKSSPLVAILDTGLPYNHDYWMMPKNYKKVSFDYYNKKYGTDYKTFDEWYYKEKYLPFKLDMVRSMHSAQNKAGIAVAMVVGSVAAIPVLAASPIVSSAVAKVTPVISNMFYGGVSKYAGMQMFANAVGQGVGNGGDVTKINLVEVGASGLNGFAPLAFGSTFNVSLSDVNINNENKIGASLATGIIGNGLMNKFQLPKSIMSDASFMTYQGMINTSINATGTLITNQSDK